MKYITNSSAKAVLALVFFTFGFSALSSAQSSSNQQKDIVSEIKMKEASNGVVVFDFAVSNSSKVPYQVLIRDADGSIVFRELVNAGNYAKRFQLNIEESDSYRFEVIQNKKVVDNKTFKITRRIEEKIEVLAMNN